MPSLRHETVRKILQERPELLLELLRRVPAAEAEPSAVEPSEADPDDARKRALPTGERKDAIRAVGGAGPGGRGRRGGREGASWRWRDEGAEVILEALPPDAVELDLPDWNADLVVRLLRPDGCGEGGRASLEHVFVVEVQLSRNWRKRYSWPVYVTCLRARHRCPCDVVVVTFDEAVARWAKKPVSLGEGGLLRALVIGPEEIPLVIDLEKDRRDQGRLDPEMALLSVLAHGGRRGRGRQHQRRKAAGADYYDHSTGQVASGGKLAGLLQSDATLDVELGRAALATLGRVDPTRVVVYLNLIFGALPRSALEMLKVEMEMEPSQNLNDYPNVRRFFRRFLDDAHQEGKKEGKKEGLAQALLCVLAARGLRVTRTQKRQITSTQDISLLESWLSRAATVSSTRELFH